MDTKNLKPFKTHCFVGEHSLVNDYVYGGQGSKIWHFCNVFGTKEHPVYIGFNSQVGSYTEIKPQVTIGNNCRFQSHVFIPDQITIEDFVFIGPGVRFMNDLVPSAKKTLDHSYKVLDTLVREHAIIGGGALIGPGLTIGKFALVGMGAVVIRNVPDYAVVVGNPAKQIGDIRDKKYLIMYPEFKELLKQTST